MKMAKSNGVSTLMLWMALAVFLIAGPRAARADGKIFAPVLVPQQVEMPDQRALLSWKDGVETLVIESAFVGKGTDFAWVVPLPSKPEVFPATSGTLPSAIALMQPTIAKPMEGAWPLAIILGGIALISLVFGWGAVGRITRVMIFLGLIAVPAVMLGAVTRSETVAWLAFGALCLFLWPLRSWFAKKTTMVEVLVWILAIAFLAALMMPAMGKVRSVAPGAPVASGVDVERRKVGDYDVAIISGQAGDDVVTWLTNNGFSLGDEARKVATEHATAGGWFVASRVRRDFSESGRSVPAPLAFRFATQQAMYPMRLTGAGAGRPLQVELVVFGPSQAEVTGLKTHTAAPLIQGKPVAQKIWWGELQTRDVRNITHPELIRWTQGTTVATWMRGELSPAQMKSDLPVHWTPNHEAFGLYALARADAWAQAVLLGALLCFVGAMILGLASREGTPSRKWAGMIVGIALVSAATLRGLTTTIATEPSSNGWRSVDLMIVGREAAVELFDLPGNASDEMVQTTFAKALVNFQPEHRRPIRMGDAPGEAMLHKLPDGSWRVWFFDSYGQPQFFEGSDIKLAESVGQQR